jgi:hypothetical protein
MALLAASRSWGEAPVVRLLGAEATAAAAVTGATVAGFLPPRGQHGIPPRYLGSLQRALAASRPAVA